jgi:hypothetical protein
VGLALTLSIIFLRLIFLCRLEGLIVFCVEAESGLFLDPCLDASIEGEVIHAFLDHSVYLQK